MLYWDRLYLYTEVQTAKANAFENYSTICPELFSHAFSEETRRGLSIAPADTGGKIEKVVFLPADQMDDLPDFSHGGSIAGMGGSRTFVAALTLDAKPVGWSKISVSPRSVISATWEFGSVWAAPEKARTDKSFGMLHLGPIISPASAGPGDAYLVVVRLNYVPSEGGGSMKQSSVQFMKVTPSLPLDIARAFPGCPSAEAFGNATTRLVGELFR